ncbi:hypothetical protein ISCGN_001927 [Ixodes scapularis]
MRASARRPQAATAGQPSRHSNDGPGHRPRGTPLPAPAVIHIPCLGVRCRNYRASVRSPHTCREHMERGLWLDRPPSMSPERSGKPVETHPARNSRWARESSAARPKAIAQAGASPGDRPRPIGPRLGDEPTAKILPGQSREPKRGERRHPWR